MGIGKLLLTLGLHLSLECGAFQGTQFKGQVSIQARENLVLTPAVRQDHFEKVEVVKDTRILQNTQASQGQGVDYQDCSVEGQLVVDTPHLEVVSKTGQRPAGLEVVPRAEFTEVQHTVVPSITQDIQAPRTNFKPAFKAALGVGIAAASLASGGLGAIGGSALLGSLATGALTASAQAFIQKGGLESLANQAHVHLREMLKEVGKSCAVQGVTLGAGQILGPVGPLGDVAKNTAVYHAIYQGNPLETLARQGILQLSAAGAQDIGHAYQNGLSGLEHKLLHGALAMASTVSLQALESGSIDWNRALLAAGTTMSAEAAAESLTGHIREHLPLRTPGEAQADYTQRCQQAGQELGTRAVASLRILSAAGLALAGKDAGDIQVSDSAVTTALEENFVKTILALAYDVAQGVKDVGDELREGNYWSAAGHGALAAGSVVLDLASAGVGSTLVKAGVRLARKALGSTEKGPEVLKREGTSRGFRPTGKRRQEQKAAKKLQNMTPEESRAYFEQYKDNPVPVGEYQRKEMKKIVEKRTQETGLEHEQHHVWPVAQSDEILKVTGRKYKNNAVIPLPKTLHQAENRKIMHKRNEQIKPENPRESLLQGVQDTRQGLLDAGCDRTKTNEACLEAIKKIKTDNPEGFSEKIPPKP